MKKLSVLEWKQIQRALRSKGFNPGTVDGIEGPNTWGAVLAFKDSVGLSNRKIIGPQTKAALFKDINPADLPPLAKPLLRRLGLHERRDTAKLLEWFGQFGKTLGNPIKYPWCAEGAENTSLEAFPAVPIPFDNPFWAQNWAAWGFPTPANKPFVGAWAVIKWFKGGGHIGLVAEISADGKSVKLLGCNQSNKIGFAWYPLESASGKIIAFRVAPSEVGKIYPPFGEMAAVGDYGATR